MRTGTNALDGTLLSGADHLAQSVADILTTPIGTLPHQRDYGSRVPRIVDNPTSPTFRFDLYEAIEEALRLWEPDLRLTEIKLETVEPGRVVIGLYAVQLIDGETIKFEGLVLK